MLDWFRIEAYPSLPTEAREFVEEVRKRLTAEGDRSRDPLEAACWFCAWQDADSIFDGLTVRELAQMVQGGERLGPYEELSDVQAWLDVWFEGAGEDDKPLSEAVEALMAKLDEFFGS